MHPGTPAQVAQSMGPPAAVPERAERAAQVTFEVQAEVIQVEASPAVEAAELVPEFGGQTSPEPDSEAPLATGFGSGEHRQPLHGRKSDRGGPAGARPNWTSHQDPIR